MKGEPAMTAICEAEVTRKGPVTYPCTCCGSPVERENVYCPRCLQAIRAGFPYPQEIFYLRWAEMTIDSAAFDAHCNWIPMLRVSRVNAPALSNVS